VRERCAAQQCTEVRQLRAQHGRQGCKQLEVTVLDSAPASTEHLQDAHRPIEGEKRYDSRTDQAAVGRSRGEGWRSDAEQVRGEHGAAGAERVCTGPTVA
jgi:hypothetical protein